MDETFDRFNGDVTWYNGVFSEVTPESHPAIKKLARAYVAECDEVIVQYNRKYARPQRPDDDASEGEWGDYIDGCIESQQDAHNEIGAHCHFLWHDVYRGRMIRERWRIAGHILCVAARFEASMLGIFVEVHYRPGNQGAVAAAGDWEQRLSEHV